jgi:dTDP-4-amino-4,6-dideoxygalactose transaminase
MAAFSPLMFRVLPPVGEPILLGPEEDPPEFPGFHPVWTQSGTAALALAVQLAAERRPDITAPEVLIPGYGCPDLVAAVHYAGARPVLVDIGVDDPAFDPEALEHAWTSSTVAVVAVNFLGIRERVDGLARVAASRDAWLIEDSAQWYPELPPGDSGPLSPADAMVLSFGRGKPVSLLGGGCLLLRKRHSRPQYPLGSAPSSTAAQLALRLTAYNWLLRPASYGWIARLPGLGIGETRYQPLADIGGMDEVRLGLLGANVRAHLGRDRWREEAISTLLAASADQIVDLPQRMTGRVGRLLRYPLLCRQPELRSVLLQRLTHLGLGATAMYGEALANVPGVADVLRGRLSLPGAEAFASRLLTLPVHSRVGERDLSCLAREIRNHGDSSKTMHISGRQVR